MLHLFTCWWNITSVLIFTVQESQGKLGKYDTHEANRRGPAEWLRIPEYCSGHLVVVQQTFGWHVAHSSQSSNSLQWLLILEPIKGLWARHCERVKLNDVCNFVQTFYAPRRLVPLGPENGENVKRGKKDGTAVCAQGVSYGWNFLTLSGALTVCPGGHINLVSLNKVL